MARDHCPDVTCDESATTEKARSVTVTIASRGNIGAPIDVITVAMDNMGLQSRSRRWTRPTYLPTASL